MCGGKVIETIVTEGRVWINCQEYHEIEERLGTQTCAIFVESTPAARAVSEGDIVWWQADYAYWTFRDSRNRIVGKANMPLKRIGFSGVKRPEVCEVGA